MNEKPVKTSGYVGQFHWAPPDSLQWMDCGPLCETREAAEAVMNALVAHFEKNKHKTSCVRTGIGGTRIIHRTVTVRESLVP